MSARTSQPEAAPSRRRVVAPLLHRVVAPLLPREVAPAVAALLGAFSMLASPRARADSPAPVERVAPRDPSVAAAPAAPAAPDSAAAPASPDATAPRAPSPSSTLPAPSSAGPASSRVDAAAHARARAARPGGAFDGRVLWTEPAPEPQPISRNAEPYCARLGTQLDGSLAVSEGGLANALIRVRPVSSPPSPPSTPELPLHPERTAQPRRARRPHRRDLEVAEAAASAPPEPLPTEPPRARLALASCAFAPRVLALVPGQHLAVESADPILHSLRLTRQRSVVFRQTLEPSEPAPELRFNEPGVYRVGCDVHPWEVAWVVVSPPDDAAEISVTDAQGHFRVEGLAPGTYQLDAWHERATITGPPIRIRAGASQHSALHATPTTELAHEDSQAHPAQ